MFLVIRLSSGSKRLLTEAEESYQQDVSRLFPSFPKGKFWKEEVKFILKHLVARVFFEGKWYRELHAWRDFNVEDLQMNCEGVQSRIRFNISQSLCPQNVTRNGHIVPVSTASYKTGSHSRCVHRMLQFEPQSRCVHRMLHSEPHIFAVSTECYKTEPHICCVHIMLHSQPHTL